jgi:hypothetical protein
MLFFKEKVRVSGRKKKLKNGKGKNGEMAKKR